MKSEEEYGTEADMRVSVTTKSALGNKYPFFLSFHALQPTAKKTKQKN